MRLLASVSGLALLALFGLYLCGPPSSAPARAAARGPAPGHQEVLGEGCRLAGIARFDDGGVAGGKELLLVEPRVLEPTLLRGVSRARIRDRSYTDELGRFAFEGVAAGIWLVGPSGAKMRLSVRPDGVQELLPEKDPLVPLGVPVEVPDGAREHEIELVVQRGLAITGRVVFPDESPAKDVLLLAVSDAAGGSMRADTRGDGSFELSPLARGTWRIFDNGGPEGWGLYDPVELEAGTRGVQLVLQQGGVLEGRAVLEDTGRAVTAWVSVRQDGGSPQPGRGVSGTTGERQDGAFRYESLQPAGYDVHAQSEDLEYCALVAGAVVAPGETTSGVELLMRPAGRILLEHHGETGSVRMRCYVGAALLDSRRIRPGLAGLVAAPPGDVRVVMEDEETGVRRERTITVEVGRESAVAWP